MAPKTGASRVKNKNIQVAATKAVEKNKTCCWIPNPALATPGRIRAPDRHRKKQVTWSVKAGLHFPVGRIGCDLKEGRYSWRIGFGVPIYLAAIFEYRTAEVLDIARKASKDNKKICIIPRHVMLGMMRDEEVSKMLVGVTIAHDVVLPNIHQWLRGDGIAEEATKLPAEDAAKLPKKTMKSP